MKWMALIGTGLLAGALSCGCARWPEVTASPLPKAGGQYKGDRSKPGPDRGNQRGRRVAAPMLAGLRHVHDPGNPSMDATLIRLVFPNGNWCNLLVGGTEVDISPLLRGSGIQLTTGWVYVHGSFPSTKPSAGQLADASMWGIWPIVVRSTVAAGAEGTTFIVDARSVGDVRVTALEDKDGSKSSVNLWDVSSANPVDHKPVEPVNEDGKYVVNAGYTAIIDQSALPPVMKEHLARPDLDSVYEKFVKSVETLAAAYDADGP